MNRRKYRLDYDNRFKSIIEFLLPEFVEFFLPKVAVEVDWDKRGEIEFLEQELSKEFKEKGLDNKRIDKLIKLPLKDGTEKYIFAHVEIESSMSIDFSERMFTYNYLIRKKLKIENLESVAIFVGKKYPKKFGIYDKKTHYTQLTFKYASYRVMEQKEEDLMKSKNSFAIVILAILLINKSTTIEECLDIKKRILDIIKNKKIIGDNLLGLSTFIKNVLFLPNKYKKIEEQYFQNIITINMSKTGFKTYAEARQVLDGALLIGKMGGQ